MASMWRPSSVNMLPPMLFNTVPTIIGVGAAGGLALVFVYKPVMAVTVQTWVEGAFTFICSPN